MASTWARDVSSPHHQVGGDWSSNRSPSSARATASRYGGRPGFFFEDGGAQRIDDAHGPAAGGGGEPGDPEPRVGPQVEGVTPGAVDPSQQDVHGLQPPGGAEPHASAPGQEVVRLGQREAEQGGQEGLVVGGLALGARGEQDDAGQVVSGRSRREERCLEDVEEAAQVPQGGLAVEALHGPRDDPAVRHRVAGAGRRLRTIRQHAPRAVGTPGQVGRRHEELALRGKPHLVRGRQEAGVTQDHLGRHEPLAQHPAGPVEVREQRVEHTGPLLQPRLEACPLLRGQDNRERVDRPRPGAGVRPRTSPRDPVVRDETLHRLAASAQPGRAQPFDRALQVRDVLRRAHDG